MRLLLIADTHVPKRANDLPPSVWAEVDRVDLVVHAGDWIEVGLLDALQGRADVLACWGNNDTPELRDRLPEVARREIEGLQVAVVHETGSAIGREARVDRAHPGTDLLVFGHSHIPWDSVAKSGLRLLNPGSPTDRRRQMTCTYMTLTISEGALHDVQLHHIAREPHRGSP